MKNSIPVAYLACPYAHPLSKGVTDEVEFAHQIGLPVEEMDFPEECLALVREPLEAQKVSDFKKILNIKL